ncbi:MAG: HDOD domain-containing protein, partial [Betaproteobacteria bacterium]
MIVSPLLFLQLLANHKLELAAVVLQVGEGDRNALLPLITDDRFIALVKTIPCLIKSCQTDSLSPEVLQAFEEAGCQTVQPTSFHHSDQQSKPVLAPNTRWLSGDWYLAPPLKLSGNQAASRTLSLKLLHLVAADADTCEIEAVFRKDPILAYHLLRLVNSLCIGVDKHISSFSQAILILGRHQLKRWLNLMLFAANRDDYRTPMLMARVAVRARSMELLAKAGGFDRSEQDQAFMAGMFSLLGVLFGMPLSEVLTPLKLNESLANAVLFYAGKTGRLLQSVEKLEQADESG